PRSRYRLGVPSRVPVQDGRVIQRCCHLEILCARRALVNFQGPFVESLAFRKSALGSVNDRQVTEAHRKPGVFRTEFFSFPDSLQVLLLRLGIMTFFKVPSPRSGVSVPGRALSGNSCYAEGEPGYCQKQQNCSVDCHTAPFSRTRGKPYPFSLQKVSNPFLRP